MNIGEWFALSSALAWAGAVILFRRSGEVLSPPALNLFKTALATVLLALIIPVWPDGIDGVPSAYVIMVLLASGAIGIALADGMYFIALNAIGASRTGLASSLFSPFVVCLSFAFLDERLQPLQWLGFGLVVGSIFFYAYKPDPQEVAGDALRRGVIVAIGAVFLMALGIVMAKPVMSQAPLPMIVLLRFLGGLIGIIVWYGLRGRLFRIVGEYRSCARWDVVIAGSLLGGFIGMILWVGGYKYASASVASILNETAAMFILLLSRVFLKEPLGPRKVLCVALSFTGVAAMILG